MTIYQKMKGGANIEIGGKKHFCENVTVELWDHEYDDAVKQLKEKGVI